MIDFHGKTAVVTGAASGIGFGLAERFAIEGMSVVLADLNEANLTLATQKLRDTGADVLDVVVDVSSLKEIEKLAQVALEKYQKVHILCNNAGVCTGGVSWETPLEDYEWIFGVNLWSVIYGVRTFLPIMEAQNEECWIVNTSSQSGLTTTPFSTEYCTTKAAVLAYSECVYKELVTLESQVHMAVLCPAAVQTNIHKSLNYRPERYKLDRELKPMETLVADALADEIKKGITPAALAEQVVQALREQTFYILPEGRWREAINTRMHEIIEGKNPSMNFS